MGLKLTFFDSKQVPEIFVLMFGIAGQEKFGGLRDGYYIQAQGAILMWDGTSDITRTNLRKWYKDIYRVEPKIPKILVNNKCDISTFKHEESSGVIECSVKTGENLQAPFLELARKLTGDESLTFLKN